MSLCNCGYEGTRIRTIWNEDGARRTECPHCAPTSFEKFTVPSEKKIWMGYEAHPNEYVKNADGGYDRKPEYRAEFEQKMLEATEEEQERQLKAEANKRATRRTLPMDAAEMAEALHRAEEIASWIAASAASTVSVN